MNKNKAKKRVHNSHGKSLQLKKEGSEWSKYSKMQVSLFLKKTVWTVNVVSNIVSKTWRKSKRER